MDPLKFDVADEDGQGVTVLVTSPDGGPPEVGRPYHMGFCEPGTTEAITTSEFMPDFQPNAIARIAEIEGLAWLEHEARNQEAYWKQSGR